MLHGQLRAHLHRRCEGRTTEPMLDRMLRWLNATVFPWLRVVLQPSAACAAPVAALEQWQARLRFFFLQLLASLRIGELFELIRDYPETLPAIEDLRECLRHTQQHEVLVARLRTALESRLLKPASTPRTSSRCAPRARCFAGLHCCSAPTDPHVPAPNQVYVCAIKALRHLEPSGVMLEAVSAPLRALT